jgi:hypothetical protein
LLQLAQSHVLQFAHVSQQGHVVMSQQVPWKQQSSWLRHGQLAVSQQEVPQQGTKMQQAMHAHTAIASLRSSADKLCQASSACFLTELSSLVTVPDTGAWGSSSSSIVCSDGGGMSTKTAAAAGGMAKLEVPRRSRN